MSDEPQRARAEARDDDTDSFLPNEGLSFGERAFVGHDRRAYFSLHFVERHDIHRPTSYYDFRKGGRADAICRRRLLHASAR